ncbi:MAG: DUF1254 domain-containing protein [Phycisphaerae bacterium]|nr:DUF1254 domain-containing protein [Phycisphaerae bacterium]
MSLAQSRAAAPAPAAAATGLTEAEVRDLGVFAYIYGYPLVTMEYTRRVMTNVAAPEGTRAPMGQFARLREYPTAAFRDVTAPNADTLYTTTWLDVSKEPWVVSLPDFGDRYFLFPMLDGWTNVFQVPGKRTTGGKAANYAITGPGWSGTLPAGVTEYKAPTSMVWILGRIYCDGSPADYAAVHALQDKITAVPLSSFGKPFTPPAGAVNASTDMKTAVRDQVNALDATAYFNLLAQLMKDNPAAAADAPALAKLAKLGIVPGQPFKPEALGAAAAGLRDVPKTGFGEIMAFFPKAGTNENGWIFTTKTGIYGTEYLDRALITAIGLGANRPQDAVYPTSERNAEGQVYDGSKSYVMRFEKGQLPPVNGFWSLTMYDANYFFVDNPLNRYTLSSRNKLTPNPDGSVDLLIQHADPGKDKQSNWLPAPAGKFVLMLRLYWPKENDPSILNGSWKIPPVHEVK